MRSKIERNMEKAPGMSRGFGATFVKVSAAFSTYWP
jgi:hypothetical protein